MSISRPYSQACENNKPYILACLKSIVGEGDRVFEAGSGTGQHAVFFSSQLPVQWFPSELPENLVTLNRGLEGPGPDNLHEPVPFDVRYTWPDQAYDGVFSANCLHIMSADSVELFFRGMNTLVRPEGFLCVYGPFNYKGKFTSESNARFDQFLRDRDPLSGIRDFEWANNLAEREGFRLVGDHTMPANNRFIHWQRLS